MPYTDDPLNELPDAVRLLVGDISATPDLPDSAIDFFLAEEGNNVVRAAARAAEALAGLYAGKAEERRVGPLWLRSFSDKSSKYLTLARSLWARAARGAGGLPYAGGISLMDKNEKIADSDRVRPFFRRQSMTYDRGSTNAQPEDLLSPADPLP